MTEIKRNRGRFVKGQSGNPSGRKKKKDSPVPSSQAIRDAFYRTFCEIFIKGGNVKEMVAFCKKNQKNMSLLIQEVRKILPEIASDQDDGPPVVVINRIITDDRKKVPDSTEEEIAEIAKKRKVYEMSEEFLPKEEEKSSPPEPEAMTDEQIKKRIEELEKRKADVLAALAEKKSNKTVN